MKRSTSELPEAIEPFLADLKPNKSVILYSGQFEIRLLEKTIVLNGTIEYLWIPKNRVVFRGETLSMGFNPFVDSNRDGQTILVVNEEEYGNVIITEHNSGQTSQIVGLFSSYILLGDGSITANNFLFAIPNMVYILGERFVQISRNGNDSFKLGRLSLRNKDFCVEINSSASISEDLRHIQNEGGYAVTHWGRLTFSKPIAFKKMKEAVFPLSMFLSFVNGRRLHVQFIRAVNDNEEIWTDYTPYRTSAYEPVITWFSIRSYDHFQGAWSKFYELWKDENDRDCLNTLVYWYLMINTNAGEGDGSLIMAQAALELIYNWMLIERDGLIIGNDSDSINASNKIRLVLNRLGVSYEIPEALTCLLDFCKDDDDLCDGPAAIVRIRNAIVHSSEKKRGLVRKMGRTVLFEALELSTWYIELSLLYILEFNGRYLNRCSGKQWTEEGEYVPWAEKIT